MDFNEFIVRFASTIARRKLLFFALFLVIFGGCVVGAYVKPQKFQSQATLLVTLQSPRVNSTHSEERQIVASVQPDEVMAAQVEIMQTRELFEEMVDTLPPWVFESKPSTKWYVRLIVTPLKKVVEFVQNMLIKAKLIEPPNERYSKIRTIEKGLTVFPVRKAQVIEVVFKSKNPEVPPVVINRLIELYQARVQKLHSEAEGAGIYEARAEQLSHELEEAERERTAFMRNNNITDMESERAYLIAQVQSLKLKSDDERLSKLIELEPQYNLLTRRVDILHDSYSVYRKVAADRQTFFDRDTNIMAQLIDPPQVIYRPLKPSRLILVLMGFALSLFLSVVIVMLVEWLAQIRGVYATESAPAQFRRTRHEAMKRAAE